MKNLSDDYVSTLQELVPYGFTEHELHMLAANLMVLGKKAERNRLPRGVLTEFAHAAIKIGREAQRQIWLEDDLPKERPENAA